ncbi:hypothetical protein MEG1DRAFT_00860 [Photorhabdus temperata subsp. temperata Meg1]|uniref:Uncharacterized protein n=2 Tax=Photorhabdus temperata TaxID=574560 RepID=A0A081S063_PHOTE|nr:hypothetical protein MEG1DRAFT_00860 [Photorhabdus temperata subsp. temperata Meg1]
MAKDRKKIFSYQVSGARTTSSIKSLNFFDGSYIEPKKPPIDIFQEKKISNLKLLGAFLISPETEQYHQLATIGGHEWQQLANLIVLGLVSSVESYFRAIVRKLLIIDDHSKRHSYTSNLTYGAALHHKKELLPEALLESSSFTSSNNIVRTLQTYLDINLGGFSKIPSLHSAFTDYEIVCHLRHCIIHRAGLLGSNNALALGLDEYCTYLEKPISINLPTVQEIALVCDILVKEINDKIFHEVLSRTVKELNWSGDLRQDKNIFKPYFDLFSPSIDNSPKNLNKCYSEFIQAHNIKA